MGQSPSGREIEDLAGMPKWPWRCCGNGTCPSVCSPRLAPQPAPLRNFRAARDAPKGTDGLRLIGDLPAGTPTAFEAAYGWSWLAGLLEAYGTPPGIGPPVIR